MVRCKFFPWNGNKYTPWTCPPDRRGFLKGDNPALWAKEHQTNVTMRLLTFRAGFISFALMVDQGSGPAVPGITTNHWWNDSPQGLQLRSQQMVGMNNPLGQLRLAKFNNRTINEVIIEGYAGDYSEFDSGYMQILHFLEEYGHLEHFLPWVYAAAPKPPPPSPSPRRARAPRSTPAKQGATPSTARSTATPPAKTAAAPAPRSPTSGAAPKAASPVPAPRNTPAVVPPKAGNSQVKPKPVKKDEDRKDKDKHKKDDDKKEKKDKEGKSEKKDKDKDDKKGKKHHL
jgi:hypothetical protein